VTAKALRAGFHLVTHRVPRPAGSRDWGSRYRRFTGSGKLARARPTKPVPPPQPGEVGSNFVLVDLGADDPCIGSGRALW
jgi:hypothetical protein